MKESDYIRKIMDCDFTQEITKPTFSPVTIADKFYRQQAEKEMSVTCGILTNVQKGYGFINDIFCHISIAEKYGVNFKEGNRYVGHYITTPEGRRKIDKLAEVTQSFYDIVEKRALEMENTDRKTAAENHFKYVLKFYNKNIEAAKQFADLDIKAVKLYETHEWWGAGITKVSITFNHNVDNQDIVHDYLKLLDYNVDMIPEPYHFGAGVSYTKFPNNEWFVEINRGTTD